MKTDGLLINGVSLPFHVLDTAIKHAKSANRQCVAVFVYENKYLSSQAIVDGVVLSRADFTDKSATIHLSTLIKSNSDFVKKYFKLHKVLVKTVVLQNPVPQEILSTFDEADQVFIDSASYSKPLDFANVRFPLSAIAEMLASKLRKCEA